MAVRLRLSRIGKKNAPVFRIIAIDSRKMRDGMLIENLGTYNPVTDKYVRFNVERFEEWLKKGALPTDSVKKLYVRFKKHPELAVEQALVEQPTPEQATIEQLADKQTSTEQSSTEQSSTEKVAAAPTPTAKSSPEAPASAPSTTATPK
jgi:small subunit ribosomal protein S16